MGTLGILIIVGVVLLVALVFGGLVWLFVRLSRPQQPQPLQSQPPEGQPTVKRATGQQARRKGRKRRRS